MVEDVLAVTVVFQVERRCCKQAAILLDQHMLRRPAGSGGNGAACLQRQEEGVRDERVFYPGASVPLRSRHPADGVNYPAFRLAYIFARLQP